MFKKYILYFMCSVGGVLLLLITYKGQLLSPNNKISLDLPTPVVVLPHNNNNKPSHSTLHSCLHEAKLITLSSSVITDTDTATGTGTGTRDGDGDSDSDAIALKEFIKGPLAQNDSRIVQYILNQGFVHPPAMPDVPYNLTTPPNVDPSMGQSRVIKKIFKYMRNGFFIECGALDGETRSNTLSLERDYDWKGLLVEGDPSNFKLIQTKNRKAWTAGCCLSIHSFPHEAMYQQDFNTGKISLGDSNNIRNEYDDGTLGNSSLVNVQCFPLFSLLSAINVTSVDYFSLDVEGFELGVLETIPFDLVQIKVLSVEFIHSRGKAEPLETFMRTKGYRVITKVLERHWYANDLIFVHESLEVTAKFPPKIYTNNKILKQ